MQYIPSEEVNGAACEVFAPCALCGVLNRRSIHQLKCCIIAGAANNQLARPEDAERLRAREILYAPGYVMNVGGAMAITGIELQGWSLSEAEEKVVESVRQDLQRIFERADAETIKTNEAACWIADNHLSD